MKKLLLPALLVSVLAACSTTPTNEQNPAPVESRSGAYTSTAGGPGVSEGALPRALTDPNSILSKRSIFFDLDKYDIRADYQSLVTAHAKFLNENRKYKILVQGNTDERGSREYNLALGQKRSDAVKKAMSLLGVSEDQIESVSMGKEKPRAEGHDEAAWAENRRADILYSGEF